MSPKTSANDWATRRRIEAERAEWTRIHGLACELCGNVPKTRGLEWDHDHKTSRHRGWLCHRCNRALPSWITADWLRKAADYLER
jgi:hypothetical protein